MYIGLLKWMVKKIEHDLNGILIVVDERSAENRFEIFYDNG